VSGLSPLCKQLAGIANEAAEEDGLLDCKDRVGANVQFPESSLVQRLNGREMPSVLPKESHET
jgi:hypothetical protein